MAYTPTSDYLKQQKEDIAKTYSQMRTGLRNRISAQQQQTREDLGRRFAINAPGGGAQEMMKQKALANVEAGFAGQEQQIGAQEAEALRQAQEQERAREFATAERTGSQEFAAQQAELQRKEAARQFDVQMVNWQKEFDENIKTNALNASVALKNAGLSTLDDWGRLGQTLRDLGYGGIIPESFANMSQARQEEQQYLDWRNRQQNDRSGNYGRYS